jgi:hypothetical protein
MAFLIPIAVGVGELIADAAAVIGAAEGVAEAVGVGELLGEGVGEVEALLAGEEAVGAIGESEFASAAVAAPSEASVAEGESLLGRGKSIVERGKHLLQRGKNELGGYVVRGARAVGDTVGLGEEVAEFVESPSVIRNVKRLNNIIQVSTGVAQGVRGDGPSVGGVLAQGAGAAALGLDALDTLVIQTVGAIAKSVKHNVTSNDKDEYQDNNAQAAEQSLSNASKNHPVSRHPFHPPHQGAIDPKRPYPGHLKDNEGKIMSHHAHPLGSAPPLVDISHSSLGYIGQGGVQDYQFGPPAMLVSKGKSIGNSKFLHVPQSGVAARKKARKRPKRDENIVSIRHPKKRALEHRFTPSPGAGLDHPTPRNMNSTTSEFTPIKTGSLEPTHLVEHHHRTGRSNQPIASLPVGPRLF